MILDGEAYRVERLGKTVRVAFDGIAPEVAWRSLIAARDSFGLHACRVKVYPTAMHSIGQTFFVLDTDDNVLALREDAERACCDAVRRVAEET